MRGKSDLAGGGVGALAAMCARHRWIVVALWAAGLATLLVFVRDSGARFNTDVAVPGTDSARAMDLVGEVVPGGGLPDTESIVLHARRGTVDDPLVREQIAAMAAELGKLPKVGGVIDPFNPAGAVVLGVEPISANRRTAVTSVIMKGSALNPDRAAARRLIDTARAYDGPDLQVEAAGPGATALSATTISPRPIIIALVAALLLLGVTLRSRGAVAVCAATSAVATVAALGAIVLISHTITTTAFAPLLAAVVAAGTSLGGAVVVVHRAQSALREGVGPVEAAAQATARAGSAVAYGGFCVTLAMDGVALLGLSFFDGVALGPAAAGAATGLVIITLLPALLALSGPRLLGWTERQHLTTSGRGLPHRPGLRAWWARQVDRRPAGMALAAGLGLILLAVPAVTLDLGGADDGAESTSLSTRRAYDLLSADFFPGLNGPMLVAVERGDGPSAVPVADVVSAIAKTPGVVKAAVNLEKADAGLAVIRIAPREGPRSPAAVDLLHRLRDDVIPRAVAGTGSRVYIGGSTALFVDMAADFRGATTLFLLVILLVVGVLGLLILRSVEIAAALAVTSVLAVLAAAGVLAILFQTDLLTTALGLETGPVEPSMLVLVLVAVFGLLPGLNLSLLVRLLEPADRAGNEPPTRDAQSTGGTEGAGDMQGAESTRNTGGTRRARRRRRADTGPVRRRSVGSRLRGRRGGTPGPIRRHRTDTTPIRRGHADVGHVMLTMNLVMLFLFMAIAAQPSRTMKVIGCGLATGVAIDAFMLRATLLPALLHLLRPTRPGSPTGRTGATGNRTGDGRRAARDGGRATGDGGKATRSDRAGRRRARPGQSSTPGPAGGSPRPVTRVAAFSPTALGEASAARRDGTGRVAQPSPPRHLAG
ncbi:MMPL family transporter [Parafrankia sp. BMG5.11]|uniref:MMPL family transporter n=2 Tax=unclassified Parafrankia TaxID=2994368 RepID=UPI0035A19CB6